MPRRRPPDERPGGHGAGRRALRPAAAPARAGQARAAGHPADDLVRGRRPAGAGQAGRPGRASGAGQPGRHAGQRAAGPLRRQPAGHRRRAAAGHRAPPGQGHVGRDGRREDRAAMAALADAFATRDLERSYLALCWGVPSPSTGEIEGAIGRDPRDRKRMALVARGGKAALTRYRVARPGTPRWRWSNAGWRPAGPTRSGCISPRRAIPSWATRSIFAGSRPSRGAAAAMRGVCWTFPRQALHAAVLGFRHPRTGAALRFETPPPPISTASCRA